MARIIPNQNTYLAFLTSVANYLAPTQAEVAAGVNLTPFLVSFNATTRGNIVQTPAFDNRFETSISGTVMATLEAEFYRDNVSDTAWSTLPRSTVGWFVLSRFGGTGTNNIPQTGNKVEVWPVNITARAASNMANNTSQTFTIQGSIPSVPGEAQTVA